MTMLHVARRNGRNWLAAAWQFNRRRTACGPTRRATAGRCRRLRGVVIAFAACCLIVPLSNIEALAQSVGAPGAVPTDKGPALDQAIHDYILAHPEVLIQSLQQAKARAEAQQAAMTKSKISTFRKALVDDPNAPVLGNPNGDVTLVEFFDYRCPFCRQVEPWVQILLKQDPGVRLVQKEFPILGPASVYAARIALAAWKQGKHTVFHNALMAKEGNMDENSIHEDLVFQVAKSVGLDIDRMKQDMNSSDVDSEIRDNIRIAKSLGLTGTPAFIVGTDLVPGATDLMTLHEMVDDARHGVN